MEISREHQGNVYREVKGLLNVRYYVLFGSVDDVIYVFTTIKNPITRDLDSMEVVDVFTTNESILSLECVGKIEDKEKLSKLKNMAAEAVSGNVYKDELNLLVGNEKEVGTTNEKEAGRVYKNGSNFYVYLRSRGSCQWYAVRGLDFGECSDVKLKNFLENHICSDIEHVAELSRVGEISLEPTDVVFSKEELSRMHRLRRAVTHMSIVDEELVDALKDMSIASNQNGADYGDDGVSKLLDTTFLDATKAAPNMSVTVATKPIDFKSAELNKIANEIDRLRVMHKSDFPPVSKKGTVKDISLTNKEVSWLLTCIAYTLSKGVGYRDLSLEDQEVVAVLVSELGIDPEAFARKFTS